MIQTKYISLDEFKDYFQIDLIEELGTQEKALAFLRRIEDRMESYLGANLNKNVVRLYANFSDYQKECYKRALLEQAIYVFKNCDISVDSGYDTERGLIVDQETIKKLSLSLNTKENLVMCGLWSRHIRGARAYSLWDWLSV